jgi:ABC-type bacteriocin/lantibiotic exporter with double-glycine peptidase domain|uniref:ABC transporter domain-containing protein n=1 Tax=viral metagenome TaxID=1070528 RepID=A0A6C0IZH3_9ZZZZ
MNTNKIIVNFLQNNKQFVLIYLVFMLSYPVSSIILPQYYTKLIDDIKENKNPKILKTLAIFMANNFMFLILDKIDTVFMPKLQSYIRQNIVKSILEKYKNNFEEQDLGVTISQIIKLPVIVKELAFQIRNYIVPLLLIFVGVIIRFSIIDIKLGVLTISMVIVSCLIIYPIVNNILKVSFDLDKETDLLHEDITELFDNLNDVYAMETADKELNNLGKNQDKVVTKYQTTFSKSNDLRMIIQVFSLIIFGSILAYAYKLMKNNQISKDNLISISITSMFIIKKIGSFSGEIPNLIQNLGSYQKISHNLSKLNSIEDTKENFEITKGSISFENVSINYGNKQIIKNFSLNIDPKESVVIIGEIGSGKSSLVKSLLKLIEYKGNIYIDGKNTKDVSTSSIRSKILFIRQNPIPFNRTIYDNITYGIDGVNENQIIDIIHKYNINKVFNKKLDFKVGRKGEKLSGGQRMIMFLLRILVQKDKKVIILDEPTSSLDNMTVQIIIDIIKDIIKKQTTIVITHDERLLEISNKVIKL